jgi:hypothetical protein
VKNEEAHEQIQQQEKQRQALETWATNRIKSWEKLNPDDYDFQSWAKKAKKNCLSAGAIYEYARESRKLRCLLALMNPKRLREAWEIVRPGSIDGRPPEPGEIDSYPAEANWFPCSFNGLDEHAAERALGGFLYCLCDLADYIADNVSFGELFHTKRDELENAFGGLNELARMKREFRYFLPVVDAVEVATQSEAERATVGETVSDDQRRIILGETHSEVIALRVRWRFSNSQIAAGIKKLVHAHRPRNQAYKPRQRRGSSRRESFQAAFDCLSAMRLASHFPKTSRATRGELSAWLSGDSPELKKSAIELFNMIRLGGRKEVAESNFDALIIKARELFLKTFPFGQSAENAPTLKDRGL